MPNTAFSAALGPTNTEVAEVLDQMADLLARQEANPWRIRAYTTAAAMLRDLDEPVVTRYATGGLDALMALPGVGPNLAHHIAAYCERGRVALRDRLLQAHDPVALLATVPGLGDALARRIVDELGVTTLGELERAAHDGRLAALPGMGPRRVEGLRLQLNSILSRAARRRARRVRRAVFRLATQPAPEPTPPAAPPMALVPLPGGGTAPDPAQTALALDAPPLRRAA